MIRSAPPDTLTHTPASAARRCGAGRLKAALSAVALSAAAVLVAGCAAHPGQPAAGSLSGALQPQAAPLNPEGASGLQVRQAVHLGRHAVAAAHPLATQAGVEMLRAGGSAVDAAVAVQMVLTLVEPQSSGIGGGAFMLHFDGRTVQAFDGRETAPAGVSERLFLKADGTPLPFYEAVVGGRSVGVPGTVAMLSMAHRQHGRLPWARLFEPAIRLSEQGFDVSPRLHALLNADAHLKRDPAAAAYFYSADGQARPVGYRLRNPELAQVLRAIARDGASAMSSGPIAQDMVAKVRQHPSNPGLLSLADLAGYRPVQREALCHDHTARGRALRICGMPPPSSGGIAVGQLLGLLRLNGVADAPWPDGRPDAAFLHRYAEASRLVFADRALYVADPDFASAPAGRWNSLLDEAYLRERARLIGPARMDRAPAGEPGGARTSLAPMPVQPEYGTSHISIVDDRGNAVSMTTTIEDAFGSRQMVRGFLLNNELTDFSFAPADAQGRPIANRVQPGKRPRSSMSPTLVFDRQTGELLMTLGSPGGSQIIHFTARTLLATLHQGQPAQQAVDGGNFASLGGPLLLEDRRFDAGTLAALRALGHEVREVTMTSGLQAIERAAAGTGHGTPGWLGAADPRREGLVLGD